MDVAKQAIVMTRSVSVLTPLVIGLAAACSDTTVRGAISSSDASTVVETTSVIGVQGGAAGEGIVRESPSANGGQGGAGEVTSEQGGQGGSTGKCWELQPWSADGCGTCLMTMSEYCATVDCTPDSLPTCDGLAGAYSIDEGCGLLKLRMNGHGDSIYTESIYDVGTRELKYHFDNGGRSMGCMPELTVGTKPTCELWITVCEGVGGA